MKAITQDRYGQPDVLRCKEIDPPVAGDDEVLIRVRAAGVNPADWFVLTGRPYVARAAFGLRRPRIPVCGQDVAGRVEAVGRTVTRFRPGDEVFGVGQGTFAEYARAKEDQLVTKPASISYERAAAVPVAAVTALKLLRDFGRLQPGQHVLINGASGGVGSFAVQIAKSFGAEVTGVCSTPNVDLLRSIGADHVVDYTREDFTQENRRYDLILDNAASHRLSDYRRVLTPSGTLIPNNGSAGGRWFGPLGRMAQAWLLSPFVSHRIRLGVATPDPENLTALRELLEAGTVTPVVDRTYPLSQAPEALRQVGTGHTRGKIVIMV